MHGLAVLQAPFFPSAGRGSGCAYRGGVGHPGVQIDQPLLVEPDMQALEHLVKRASIRHAVRDRRYLSADAATGGAVQGPRLPGRLHNQPRRRWQAFHQNPAGSHVRE